MKERKLSFMPYAQAYVCEYRKNDGDLSNSDFLEVGDIIRVK